MKIFLTGAAGFIGFHTAHRLCANGHSVVGIDNVNDYYQVSLKEDRIANLPTGVDFRRMDIADADAVRALVTAEKPDVVVHLAAQAGVRYSIENPFSYAHSNLLGHLSILEACRHSDSVQHLVYASSSSVYGESSTPPFSEAERADQPVSLYAATKRSNELLSASYAHLYGLKQIGMRFFTVYGRWGRPDMAYWMFTDKMLRGEPIRVFNQGKMRRDMTHVDDIVQGVVASVEKPPVFDGLDRPHKVYNIGNNRPEQLMDIITVIEQAVGREADKQYEGMQMGDVTETYADIDAIARDYGYAPTTPISKGIPDFVDWFRAYHGL